MLKRLTKNKLNKIIFSELKIKSNKKEILNNFDTQQIIIEVNNIFLPNMLI